MAGKPIDDLAVVISASLDQLQNDLGRGRAMLKDFAKAAEQARPPSVMDGMGRAAVAAARGVGMVASAARAAAGYAGQLAGGIAAVARNVIEAETGLTSFSGIVQHLKEAVNLAADAEQTALSFEVMLGSAQQANKMLADARAYAASTPFSQANIINSAKQLTAYGVAADQVIPTVKMLGDISAGVNKPIEEMAYLYGTLYTQQRAYTRDINQFTTAGVDVIPALSKVMGRAQDEIKQLTEDGRVGRDEVTKAFIAMTSEGGRFYRMTDRQGKTFKGQWEQMADAFQLAKTKLGGVLIEELGLKDVAQDMGGFANRLEKEFDRVRPTVRAVGDGVKNTVKAVWDVGRAAVDVGPKLLRAFGLGKFGDTFREMLNDAQGFFSRPEKIAGGIIDIAEPFAMAFAHIRKWTLDLAGFIDRNLIKPFQWFRRDFDELNPHAKPNKVKPGEAALPPALLDDRSLFAPPTAAEGPQDYARSLREMERRNEDLFKQAAWVIDHNRSIDQLKQMAAEGPQGVRAAAAERLKQMQAAFGAFAVPQGPARGAILSQGQFPDFAEGFKRPGGGPAWKPREQPGPPPDPVKEMADAMAGLRASARRFGEEREAAAAQERAAKELGEAAARQKEAAELGILGGAGFAARGLAGAGSDVRLQGDPGADVVELVRSIKREFGDVMDPLFGELGSYKLTLDKARKRDMISDDLYALAWTRKVEEVARQKGAGQPYQLPQAVAVGTAEDARVLTQWMSGQATQTTESLLRQLVDISREELRLAKLKAGQGAGGNGLAAIAPALIGGP